jgi:hypothetical protein
MHVAELTLFLRGQYRAEIPVRRYGVIALVLDVPAARQAAATGRVVDVASDAQRSAAVAAG